MEAYIIIQKYTLRTDGYVIGAEDRFLSTIDTAEMLILTNQYYNLGHNIKYYTDPDVVKILMDQFSKKSYISAYSSSEDSLYQKISTVYKKKLVPKICEYYHNYQNKLIAFYFKCISYYCNNGWFYDPLENSDLCDVISIVNTFEDLKNVMPSDLINLITNYIFEWQNKDTILMKLKEEEVVISTNRLDKYQSYTIEEFLEICDAQNFAKFTKYIEDNKLNRYQYDDANTEIYIYKI